MADQTVTLTLDDLTLDVARAVLDLIESGDLSSITPAKKGKAKAKAKDADDDDVVDDDEDEWEDEEEETVSVEDLDDMSFKELKAFAEEKGVEFKSGTKSPGLRKAIIEQVFADDEEDDDEWEAEDDDDDEDEWEDEEEDDEEDEDEEEAWDEDELKAMSLGELKATAKEWGVPTAKKKKAQIIKALLAQNS